MEPDRYTHSNEPFDDDADLMNKNFGTDHTGLYLVIVYDEHFYIYHKDYHSLVYDDVVRDDDKMVQNCSFLRDMADLLRVVLHYANVLDSESFDLVM